jgi:hypothetical protein
LIPAGPEEGKALMTKEELKAYNDALIARMLNVVNITSDECFKIEDLKEWLYAIACNNKEYLDCINDIVNRLPGFIQYTKDKKEGII